MKIYISRGKKQFGPYALELAKQYLQEGKFKETDLACHDGKNWVSLTEVPGITQAQTLSSGKPAAPKISLVSKQPKLRITVKSGSSQAIGSSLPDGNLLSESRSNKHVIFIYAGAALTILCLFFPWYVSGSERHYKTYGGELKIESSSKWYSGFAHRRGGPDNLNPGILTLILSLAAVIMTFITKTKKFLAIPMGLAALATLLPLYLWPSRSGSYVFFETRAEWWHRTSWGLWLCFIVSAATCALMLVLSFKEAQLRKANLTRVHRASARIYRSRWKIPGKR